MCVFGEMRCMEGGDNNYEFLSFSFGGYGWGCIFLFFTVTNRTQLDNICQYTWFLSICSSLLKATI